jgi:general stress protein YciG
MPNNNPAGHNQYTKRKEHNQLQPGDASGESSGDASMESSERTMTDASSGPPSTPTGNPSPARRGFAAMDEATQRGIASKGGQSQGKENNPGNFANDRDRAREAGRKGGESHGANR